MTRNTLHMTPPGMFFAEMVTAKRGRHTQRERRFQKQKLRYIHVDISPDFTTLSLSSIEDIRYSINGVCSTAFCYCCVRSFPAAPCIRGHVVTF